MVVSGWWQGVGGVYLCLFHSRSSPPPPSPSLGEGGLPFSLTKTISEGDLPFHVLPSSPHPLSPSFFLIFLGPCKGSNRKVSNTSEYRTDNKQNGTTLIISFSSPSSGSSPP
eukprot:Hpha_TRINITY_DN13449_c0_g1::TRINITY_DN13449_c0_g1_i1::g.131037::m.131037